MATATKVAEKVGEKISRLLSSPLVEQSITRNVRLVGLKDLMTDRYPGDNQTQLEPWQKLYFLPDGKTLCMPALNIMSFLSAHNTNSAPKRLRDKRKYKDIANSMLSFVTINPDFIPILRNGKPIEFGRFEGDVDATSGCYIHRSVARLDKGIPNPKVRPTIPLPWEIEFSLTMMKNREIQEQDILNLMDEGGRAIGLGTFRGVFGKFYIDSWE